MTEQLIIKTADIAKIMLGRALTVAQILKEIEVLQGVEHTDRQKLIVRNVICSMIKSNNVSIDIEKKETAEGVWRCHYYLRKIDASYFRSCSTTRRTGITKKEVKKTTKEKKAHTRLVLSVREINEINVCRLANAVDNAIRGNGWVAPNLLEKKKYTRLRKEDKHDT